MGPHRAVGFVGPVLYRVNAPEKRWRWLSLLLSLARYIGGGAGHVDGVRLGGGDAGRLGV